MEIVLDPSWGEDYVIVRARFVTAHHKEVLARTGYVQLELYPRKNNFPHTVGGLMMLGQLRVDCMDDDTPETTYAKVVEKMSLIAEVLQIEELGGSPSQYKRPRETPRPSYQKGGEEDSGRSETAPSKYVR